MGIAKALAAKNGYELDSNQEVVFNERVSLPTDIKICSALIALIKTKGINKSNMLVIIVHCSLLYVQP